MSTNPASFLSVTNQIYNPETNVTAVDFGWIRGVGSAGETIVNQTLIVSQSTNVNCVAGVICQSVGPGATFFSMNNLLPGFLYHWTILTDWSVGPDLYSIPILTFTTLNTSAVPSLSLMPLPPIPGTIHAPKPLPDFPFTTGAGGLSPISFRPATHQTGTGGGGGTVTPGGTTLNSNINYCWQYSGTPGNSLVRVGDGLGMIIAIMLAESAGHADACSRDEISGCTFYELCPGPASAWKTAGGLQANGWGLFQMNVCGGQGAGHNRDFWLNPQNNAQFGVPPCVSAINSNGGMTTTNYSDAQIMGICIASGHPGGSATNPTTIAGFNNIKGMYNRVKLQVRVTNFPLASDGDFQY